MARQDTYDKVYFNVEVMQFNCDQSETNFDSFMSNLTSIFNHHSFKSCCVIHPSGVEYQLMEHSEANKSQKVIPNLGDCVDPVTWKGYVELPRHDLRRHWINLVRRLCFLHSRKPSHCAIWRFDEDPNFLQLIGVERNIELDETPFPTSIYAFSLGNIINGNRFMIHFGSFWLNPPILTYNDKRKTEISIEDIKIKDNYKKKFVLKFTLKTSTSDTLTKIESKYRLVYDYKSIKRVHILLNRANQIRLYFQLLYPPRIFVEAPKKKFYDSKRARTSDCGDKLSSHVIGKSDVLRLVINIEDDSIITTIYRWQKYHHFDICYGSLTEYNMKPIKPKYKLSFPLSVNYALNCIYSIGYHFLDDLNINHGGVEVLNEIILKYVKANKEELIVEALHRLFDAYLVGKVYNAIEHLKSLLNQIESEWINDTNDRKNKDKTTYQSWAIITPTRTIFTPPIAYDTSSYLTDHLIRVIVRDENIDLSILYDKNMYRDLDDRIPYKERSKANDQFLNSFVGEKIVNLECLRTTKPPVRSPKVGKTFRWASKKGYRHLRRISLQREY
uniref:PH-like domain-containing protein n=1 Tax=Tetranychus urticae TaxID=32264 RepID=T1JWL7_TETUR